MKSLTDHKYSGIALVGGIALDVRYGFEQCGMHFVYTDVACLPVVRLELVETIVFCFVFFCFGQK